MGEVQPSSAAEIDSLVSGPILLDGRRTRAPAVIAVREDSVAVWLVDLAGAPCGAWVWTRLDNLMARRVLAVLDRRALIAVDPIESVASVCATAELASVRITEESLFDRICSIPELLMETSAARAKIEAAVKDEADVHGKKLAPMKWSRPVPSEVSNDVTSLLAQSGVAQLADSREALPLQISRLARWAIGLWTDTESKRVRRSYLRLRFGPSRPLPATWRRAVTRAYELPYESLEL